MPLLKEYNPEKRSLCSPLKPSSSRIQIGNKPQAKPVSTLQQNDARATRRRFGFRIVYANVSENEYVVVGCPSSPPPPAPPRGPPETANEEDAPRSPRCKKLAVPDSSSSSSALKLSSSLRSPPPGVSSSITAGNATLPLLSLLLLLLPALILPPLACLPLKTPVSLPNMHITTKPSTAKTKTAVLGRST